jgi:hypothetical protein
MDDVTNAPTSIAANKAAQGRCHGGPSRFQPNCVEAVRLVFKLASSAFDGAGHESAVIMRVHEVETACDLSVLSIQEAWKGTCDHPAGYRYW